MGYFDDIQFINVHEVKDYYVANKRLHRKNSFYSLEYIYKGSIKIFPHNGQAFIIEAPAIYWLSLDKYHFQAVPNISRSQIWTNIKGQRADRIYAELQTLSPSNYIRPRDPILIYELFCDLMRLYRKGLHQEQNRMVIQLELILNEIIKSSQHVSQKNDHISKAIQQLVQKVKTQPLEPWDFKHEAKKLNMSYSSLREHFRRITGTPIHDYLLRSKISYAITLMHDQQLSIQETAYQCNFNDLSSFSRLFKKQTGISPRDYQNMIMLP